MKEVKRGIEGLRECLREFLTNYYVFKTPSPSWRVDGEEVIGFISVYDLEINPWVYVDYRKRYTLLHFFFRDKTIVCIVPKIELFNLGSLAKFKASPKNNNYFRVNHCEILF